MPFYVSCWSHWLVEQGRLCPVGWYKWLKEQGKLCPVGWSKRLVDQGRLCPAGLYLSSKIAQVLRCC
jgi:hypothetical protein